jgi:hypothetical protein
VQADRADARLMMPSSRKGRGRKRIERKPVPIAPPLTGRAAITSGFGYLGKNFLSDTSGKVAGMIG